MNLQESTNGLLQLIQQSQSLYHTMEAASRRLEEAGFQKLELTEISALEPGKAYYVAVYDRTLVAFRVPTGTLESFRIEAAHIDTPCFVIKPNPERKKSGCLTLNVERYGGPILNTWMDRPLTIAGRVCVATDDAFAPKTMLYSSQKPVAVIPNLAIHMNREVNKGIELKVQTDMEPIVAFLGENEDTKDWLLKQIARELAVEPQDILDFELSLCSAEQPVMTGFQDEFISAPRLDNLTSCQSCLNGIVNTEALEHICTMSVLFDNEECGSRSKQGAGSVMLSTLMEKIYLNMTENGGSRNGFLDAMLKSIVISMDVAHATHPNHPEKNDPTNLIPMDAGVVIKLNNNQRYSTDTLGSSIVAGICKAAEISCKKFVNQGDQMGGGTLGSILSATIPAMTVDVGVPILAMHSSREMMSAASQLAMDQFAEAFFK